MTKKLFGLSSVTHEEVHFTVGTFYASGFTPSSFQRFVGQSMAGIGSGKCISAWDELAFEDEAGRLVTVALFF